MPGLKQMNDFHSPCDHDVFSSSCDRKASHRIQSEMNLHLDPEASLWESRDDKIDAPSGNPLIELVKNESLDRLIHVKQGETCQLLILSTRAGAVQSNITVYQEAGSVFKSMHIMQSDTVHHDVITIHLQGQGAQCEVRALQLGRGTAQIQLDLSVHHEADASVSEIEVRGVAKAQSRLAFRGLIHVVPHVKEVVANEQNKNLLLSRTAIVDSKPELEIDSSDVICRHGSSVGSLDENALFYLETRGFSEPEARDILVKAFVMSLFKEDWDDHARYIEA